MEIKQYGNCKAVSLETFEDAQKYGKSTGWPVFIKKESFDATKAKGDLFLIQDTESKAKYLFQPASKDVEAFDKANPVNTEEELFTKYPELKDITNTNPNPETLPAEQKPVEEEKPVETKIEGEEKPVTEAKSLQDLYTKTILEKRQGKRRDINASTAEVAKKAHPKSPIMFDLEAELLGLNPEDVKRLPTKAIEMMASAVKNLLQATEEDPLLRSALRKYVNRLFSTPEEECEGEECMDEFRESKETYSEFLKRLTEAKAQRFNYKMLLDIEPTKIMSPVFMQLLQTFELTELTRLQKQGVLIFLRKLAELADNNPMIANALHKIIRTENVLPREDVV